MKRLPLCHCPNEDKVPGTQVYRHYYGHQHPFNFCVRNSTCNQIHWCVLQPLAACNYRNNTGTDPIDILPFDSSTFSTFYILDSSEFSSQYSPLPNHELFQEKVVMIGYWEIGWLFWSLLTFRGRVVLGKELGGGGQKKCEDTETFVKQGLQADG